MTAILRNRAADRTVKRGYQNCTDNSKGAMSKRRSRVPIRRIASGPE